MSPPTGTGTGGAGAVPQALAPAAPSAICSTFMGRSAPFGASNVWSSACHRTSMGTHALQFACGPGSPSPLSQDVQCIALGVDAITISASALPLQSIRHPATIMHAELKIAHNTNHAVMLRQQMATDITPNTSLLHFAGALASVLRPALDASGLLRPPRPVIIQCNRFTSAGACGSRCASPSRSAGPVLVISPPHCDRAV